MRQAGRQAGRLVSSSLPARMSIPWMFAEIYSNQAWEWGGRERWIEEGGNKYVRPGSSTVLVELSAQACLLLHPNPFHYMYILHGQFNVTLPIYVCVQYSDSPFITEHYGLPLDTAWLYGRPGCVHAWVYALRDGYWGESTHEDHFGKLNCSRGRTGRYLWNENWRSYIGRNNILKWRDWVMTLLSCRHCVYTYKHTSIVFFSEQRIMCMEMLVRLI